jgi:glycosyltransferase involved in cell wall biosynthesis
VTDAATQQTVRELQNRYRYIRAVIVDEPGLIAARHACAIACTTDILCFTDDDAIPHNDWLERIVNLFNSDPRIGGVGGRDIPMGGRDEELKEVVGKIQWFGRTIGNFHLGKGGPREVDLLKGANMSYRSEVFKRVKADRRLRGNGAQPCEDKAFSVAVKKAGWKLVYDPSIQVDHYVAIRDEPRHYGGITQIITARDVAGLYDNAFNEMLSVAPTLSMPRKVAYAAYSILVGTGVTPGLIQAVRFTRRLGIMSWKRFIISQRGIVAAFARGYWRS